MEKLFIFCTYIFVLTTKVFLSLLASLNMSHYILSSISYL